VLLSCGTEQCAIDHALLTRGRPTHGLSNGTRKDGPAFPVPFCGGRQSISQRFGMTMLHTGRHLADALPRTHLARSACPNTRTSHEGSAIACSVMQPQHHCCGVEQAQRVRCRSCRRLGRELTETKRGPTNLTIRAVVRDLCITDTSGVSGFQLLCTLAMDVDGGCRVRP
jgi:hypothetical protein